MRKQCNTCGTSKPLTAFYRSKRGRFGRVAECKLCRVKRNRKRYEEKCEEIKEQARVYRKLNSNVLRMKRRGRYRKASSTVRKTMRECNKRWRDKNRARMADHCLKYLARRRTKTVEDVDRNEIYSRDRGYCYLCGKPIKRKDLELDHVRPLSRGGEHSRANVKATHRRCNRSKGNKLVSELKGRFCVRA